MKVKFWGTRGSIATPETPKENKVNLIAYFEKFEKEKGRKPDLEFKQFLDNQSPTLAFGLGGDTTCAQVTLNNNQTLLIDAGSGLRRAGDVLMKGDCGKGKGEVHIYFTHFHWDHLMGLPFFIPIYIPGNKINFYSVNNDLEKTIEMIFTKPYFPVPFKELAADISFTLLEPRNEAMINGFALTPYKLDHPDPCWGARIVGDEKVYAHCVDNEATRVSRKELGEDLPLYQGVDCMLFDAQYSFDQHLEKMDWGHASAHIGIDLAYREGIKKMIFTHHDPAASRQDLYKLECEIANYNKMMQKNHGTIDLVDFLYGYDGLEIEL